MAARSRTKQKLRESCTSCAMAKVKCSKGKPICGRCEERGFNCLYAPSHRYGRLPTSARGLRLDCWSGNRSLQCNATGPGCGFGLNNDVPPGFYSDDGGENMLFTPFSTPEIHRKMSNITSYLGFEEDAALLLCDDLGETLGTQSNSVGGFDLSSQAEQDFSTLDAITQDSDVSVPSSIPCFGNRPPMEPLVAERQVDLSSSGTSLHSPNLNLTISDSRPNATDIVESEPHSCLHIATGLLLQLKHAEDPPETSTTGSVPFWSWPNDENGSGTQSESTQDSATEFKYSVEGVTAVNRRTLEQCMSILFCRCSMMEEVTIVLALVALRVIQHYARVPKSVANVDHMDPHAARACVQVVLEDLYRFLPLLEILARRWEKHEPAVLAGSYGENSRDATEHVSGMVLKGLEADLRSRLQTVTDETVAIIRQLGSVSLEKDPQWV